MCRSKKIMAALLGLAMTISLAGCGSSGGLFTDAASGNLKDIAIEDYLKTDVVVSQEQPADNTYQVHVLQKGTFEQEAMTQILKRSYINVPSVRLSLDGIEAQFGEYVVDTMQYVEAGDVVATVYTEVDEIAIEEAKIKLQRLQERYQAAEIQMNEDLQDLTDEKALIYNDYKRQIMDIRYNQRQLDWEYEKYNYERQIEAAREEVDKLTEVGEVYEVKATTAGYVNFSKLYSAGDELKDGDYICNIMNSSEVYTVTETQADQYYYGMQVEFDSRNGITPGKVADGGSWALHGNLDTGKTIFRLEFEQDVSQLDMTGLNSLTLNGKLKTIENVVLVPKKAVTVQGDEYFVTVMKEDETFLKTEFIPGGYNDEFFWVLDGLTEGTQIIYN